MLSKWTIVLVSYERQAFLYATKIVIIIQTAHFRLRYLEKNHNSTQERPAGSVSLLSERSRRPFGIIKITVILFLHETSIDGTFLMLERQDICACRQVVDAYLVAHHSDLLHQFSVKRIDTGRTFHFIRQGDI